MKARNEMEPEKKYSFEVAWSREDEAFVATCPDFEGVSGFGDTEIEALQEAKTSLRLAIETYQAEGWALPEATRQSDYSGKFKLRIPPRKHADLAHRAKADGVSLNTYILGQLALAEGKTSVIEDLKKEVQSIHQRAVEAKLQGSPLATNISDKKLQSTNTPWASGGSTRTGSARSDN